jgi:hypothetical protein
MSRSFLLGVLVAALAYIMYLQRELATARSRGDMYRDIAASLDRQRTHSSVGPATTTSAT